MKGEFLMVNDVVYAAGCACGEYDLYYMFCHGCRRVMCVECYRQHYNALHSKEAWAANTVVRAGSVISRRV